MPATFVNATPLIPAGPSVEEALRLYVGHLGFHVVWQAPGAAGIEREGVSFNLVQNSDRHWAENCSVSIGVKGLVPLYYEYADIPARVGPLEVKAWGRNEFHIVLPSGVCLQFYEAEELPSAPPRSTD
jgi:hypothetical protein